MSILAVFAYFRGIENDSRKICFLAFLHDKLTNMYIVVIFIFLLSLQLEAIKKKKMFYHTQTFIKDVKAVWVVLGGLRHQGGGYV